jgi:hypothetical protein
MLIYQIEITIKSASRMPTFETCLNNGHVMALAASDIIQPHLSDSAADSYFSEDGTVR